MDQVVLETEEILESMGLKNIIPLDEDTKDELRKLEKSNNLGIFECLNRDLCFIVTHDSSFREPEDPITLVENGKTIFPPVGFPEIDGAISSSPGKDAHEFLVKKFGLELEDDASLIIGLDY